MKDWLKNRGLHVIMVKVTDYFYSIAYHVLKAGEINHWSNGLYKWVHQERNDTDTADIQIDLTLFGKFDNTAKDNIYFTKS